MRFTSANQIDVFSREFKIFEQRALFRDQRVAHLITGKMIANHSMLNPDRTDDVVAILGILSGDLLDEDKVADSLLLVNQARLFDVCHTPRQL